MPTISVIIPFYNVESYIVKCIESVKNQTFTDFECILIDDESPDRSKEIAQQCIVNDHRFRIISQKNKGLGGARNTGIDNAKGEWIAFLDSDDWWESNFLEQMYKVATTEKVDMVVCRYKSVKQEQIISLNKQYPQGIYQNKNELLCFFLTYPTAWNKLYKKELWKNVRFPEKLYYEDLATTFQLVFETSKIFFIDDALICYNLREGSITRYFNQKQIEDRFKIFEIIEQKLKEKSLHSDKHLTFIYLLHIVYTTYDNIVSYKTDRDKKTILVELKNRWDKRFFNIKSIWSVHKELSFIKTFMLIVYLYSVYLSYGLFLLKNKLK